MKQFIFMSGQLSMTLSLAVSKDWGYTRTSRVAKDCGDFFVLDTIPFRWKGGIYYAADSNKEIVLENLKVFKNFHVWPLPDILERMVDRHEVAKECIKNGFFAENSCEVLTYQECEKKYKNATYDCVLKVGNEHSGEGKYLIREGEYFPEWNGLATLQPFFVGRSIRLLHIEETIFAIETINENSWIKNSFGGENVLLGIDQIPETMINHSTNVANHFGLEVCGNDYICTDDGFFFLETNQFPGLDETMFGDIPKNFFLKKMRSLENSVNNK